MSDSNKALIRRFLVFEVVVFVMVASMMCIVCFLQGVLCIMGNQRTSLIETGDSVLKEKSFDGKYMFDYHHYKVLDELGRENEKNGYPAYYYPTYYYSVLVTDKNGHQFIMAVHTYSKGIMEKEVTGEIHPLPKKYQKKMNGEHPTYPYYLEDKSYPDYTFLLDFTGAGAFLLVDYVFLNLLKPNKEEKEESTD